MIPDLIGALVTALKADSGVAAVVGTRVFGGHLPDSETSSMPRACVVIQYAGSPNIYGSGAQEYGDKRVDVRSYGATPFEANRLWRTVHPALKTLTREVHSQTLVHWVKPVGGPNDLREPDTDYPFVLSTWWVLMSEIAVV